MRLPFRLPVAVPVYTRAFSTLGCPERSLAQAGALARRHELDALELRTLGGSLDLPARLQAECGTPEGFARAVAGLGLRVPVLGTSARLFDGSPTDRASLEDFVPWAEAAGVPWLRVFDGGTFLDTAAVAAARSMLVWWRKLAADRGWRVQLLVETHDTLLDANRIGRFLDGVRDEAVALLWDAHHTWRRGGEDPAATWRVIGPHVAHIHVKDSVSADGRASRYVLPGTGDFPLARLRPELAAGFNGTVSLEWEKHWHPELPTLEAALDAARESSWW